MARPVLPTVALTRSRVPTSADGKQGAFFEFNGYEAAGDQDTMVDIMRRAEADGLASLTIHELRIEIFRTIRAMRQAFEYDTGNRHIEASLGMIHEILDARGPHVGVWRGDLTTLDVDAVVNAANERMLGGGGVDGAIHRSAGPGLLAACRAVPEVRPGVRCPTGEARVTPGFDLPASHVIHAVGPVWRGGGAGEDDLLASAYRNSLRLAAEHGAASVAFPAISTGVFGFPADRAARVAVDTVRTWQAEHGGPLAVVLVAFDAAAEAVLRDALA